MAKRGSVALALALLLVGCATARDRYVAAPKPDHKIFVRSLESAETQCTAYMAAMQRNGDVSAGLLGSGVGALAGSAVGLGVHAGALAGGAAVRTPPTDQDYRDCMDRYGYTTSLKGQAR